MARAGRKYFSSVQLCVFFLWGGLLGCEGTDGADDGGENQQVDAGATADYDQYVIGLEKEGSAGEIEVRLMEAQPGPPEEGENTWSIEVVASNGDSLVGANVTLTPWMPAHGHGTNPANYNATAGENAGHYTVGPFVLTMPGLWELTIKIVKGEEINDEVKYAFQIEG